MNIKNIAPYALITLLIVAGFIWGATLFVLSNPFGVPIALVSLWIGYVFVNICSSSAVKRNDTKI